MAICIFKPQKKRIFHCIICMNNIFHNKIPDLILIPSFTTLRICDFPDTPHHLHHYYILSYFIKIFPSRSKVQTFQTNDQIGQWQLLRWKNNPEESRFVRLQGNSTKWKIDQFILHAGFIWCIFLYKNMHHAPCIFFDTVWENGSF